MEVCSCRERERGCSREPRDRSVEREREHRERERERSREKRARERDREVERERARDNRESRREARESSASVNDSSSMRRKDVCLFLPIAYLAKFCTVVSPMVNIWIAAVVDDAGREAHRESSLILFFQNEKGTPFSSADDQAAPLPCCCLMFPAKAWSALLLRSQEAVGPAGALCRCDCFPGFAAPWRCHRLKEFYVHLSMFTPTLLCFLFFALGTGLLFLVLHLPLPFMFFFFAFLKEDGFSYSLVGSFIYFCISYLLGVDRTRKLR